MNNIVTQIGAQNKLEKSEAGLAGAPAHDISAVKNMNLPEIPRNIDICDISIKVSNLLSFKEKIKKATPRQNPGEKII